MTDDAIQHEWKRIEDRLMLVGRGAETGCNEIRPLSASEERKGVRPVGTLTDHGYIQVGTNKCYAHHLAFFSLYGRSLMQHARDTNTRADISHLCHNKVCVNPYHLFLENTYINKSRSFCAHLGAAGLVCTHDPPCLVPGKDMP